MFQIGDQVTYGIHGVRNVINEEKRVIDKKHVTYLVLEPVGQTGSRYLVPTHNEAAMGKLRKLLTKQEVEQMLSSFENSGNPWISDENQRKQIYRVLIGSGERSALIAMVSSLYRHKAAQKAAGKKFHLCDENFLRDAEKLLCSEISVVMGISPEDARPYLKSKLNKE